ncbi:C-type lectin domain family 4 member E-like isoform X5 [Pithys albifrons albifrons]|uniref:C-type lectin domain family 4 member E-like isoform X5 n=1 Tax=Pithys albifrons albifrons TaxID=3385563 RepID=UPI003A5CF34D
MNCQGRVSPGTAVVLLHGSHGQYKTLLQNSTEWHCVPNISANKMAPFSCSSDQPTALQEKFTTWQCDSVMSQGKGRGWMCCPKGWKRFQKSCYFLSPDKMSWVESEQNCTGMGSHLAVINSREEQVFLFGQIKQPSRGENFYIGLRASSVDQWQWVDKTPYNVSATFWRKGKPSDHNDENCVVMYRDSELPNNWNNVRCLIYHRICEAAAVTV